MADDGSEQSAAVWPLPKFRFEVKWEREEAGDLPGIVERLRQSPGVTSCEWNATGDSKD